MLWFLCESCSVDWYAHACTISIRQTTIWQLIPKVSYANRFATIFFCVRCHANIKQELTHMSTSKIKAYW